MNRLFTIGHSNLEWDAFVSLLRQHDIPLVADVRSRPQSFRFPHFSQPELEQSLREAGIGYLFLGEELGGRPPHPLERPPQGFRGPVEVLPATVVGPFAVLPDRVFGTAVDSFPGTPGLLPS